MSEDDKKLLEMAALAADHKIKWRQEWSGGKGCMMRHIWREPEPLCDEWLPWNTLENDGDALRLSVALAIDVDHSEDSVWAGGERTENYQLFEWHNDDKCAAMRRAVTRVAAEIGKLKCTG